MLQNSSEFQIIEHGAFDRRLAIHFVYIIVCESKEKKNELVFHNYAKMISLVYNKCYYILLHIYFINIINKLYLLVIKVIVHNNVSELYA